MLFGGTDKADVWSRDVLLNNGASCIPGSKYKKLPWRCLSTGHGAVWMKNADCSVSLKLVTMLVVQTVEFNALCL